MKIRSAIVAGIAGAIVLGTAASVLSADYVQPGERIRVAYFPNVGHAIPIVGMEKGIFEDHLHGMVIQTRIFDSGPQVIEALFADSIDIAYVGPGPAINGYLNSDNVVVLSGAASGGASFIAHPDSVGDDFIFDGKKIGAPQIGNTQDVSLRHHLSESGLKTAEKGGSVTVYNIPNPDIYTLFVKGEIDGAWVAEPWATILEQDLGGVRLFHEEDLWPNNEFASVLLIANADYVAQNPQAIGQWLKAHDYVVDVINADKKDAGKLFNDFLTGYLGQGLDARVVDVSLSNIEITSDPLEDSVHVFAERADRLGYLGRDGYDISGLFYDANLRHDSEGGND